MTKTKSTKRALLMSGLALLLCFSMLIGSTFAWFTDSVTSVGNKIQAGTLKVDLEMLEEDGSWTSIKDSKKAIFDYDKWEPGYTDVKVLRVTNEGTLALKWMAKFVSMNELSALADIIEVYVKEGVEKYPENRTDLSDWTKAGTVKDFVNTIETTTTGNLEANTSDYLGIALKMQEKAGNEYQGMDLGGAFDIMIMATQYTSESDSFDKLYDEDAYFTAEIDSIKARLAAAQAGDTVTLNLTHDAYLGAGESLLAPDGVDMVINGNGYTIFADEATHVIAGKRDTDITIKNLTIVGKTKDDAIISQNNGVGGVNIAMENVKVDLTDIKGVNWPVCFGGTGTATLTNCEITGAGIESGDYADGNQFFAGAKMNVTFVNTKIDSVMLNGSQGGDSATLNIDAASKVGVVILEAKTTSVISGDATGIESILIPGMSEKEAGNIVATEMEDKLQAGEDVVLMDDITFSASATDSNSGYAATGLTIDGTTFDGNGNTLTVKDANSGWACAINPKSGTVKNVTVAGAFRGIFMGGANGDVYIENVTFDTVYTFNSDAGNKDYGVYFNNCVMNGWTSYSNCHKEVVFTDCTFTEGNGYAFLRAYNNTEFKNCKFDASAGFEVQIKPGATATFENCYYGDTLITAANIESLGLLYGTDVSLVTVK